MTKSFHFDVPRLSLVRGSLFFFLFWENGSFFQFYFHAFPDDDLRRRRKQCGPFFARTAQKKKKKKYKKKIVGVVVTRRRSFAWDLYFSFFLSFFLSVLLSFVAFCTFVLFFSFPVSFLWLRPVWTGGKKKRWIFFFQIGRSSTPSAETWLDSLECIYFSGFNFFFCSFCPLQLTSGWIVLNRRQMASSFFFTR